MPLTDPSPEVVALHNAFNQLTGADLRPLRFYDYERIHGYRDFLRDFTVTDLTLVAEYLLREIKAGRRQRAALLWRNTIGDLTRFEDDLTLAKAAQRNAKPPPSAKEKAVAMLRPTVAPKVPTAAPKQASAVVETLIANLRRAAM